MNFLQRIPTQIPFLGSVVVTVVAIVWNLGFEDAAGRFGTVGLALAYLAMLLVFESRVALNSRGAEARSDDRGTGQAIACARLVHVACALLWPVSWTHWQLWVVLPGLLVISGVVLRHRAIRTLGRFYSRRVRTLEDHQAVTHGPYRFVRHPAYTGALLMHLGMTLYQLNVLSVVTFLALLAPAFVWRIRTEERLLMKITGYEEYARGRRRLLPLVW
ncbi:isoprenylcysteine carboxylmethyltransferase family protein [Streptomyces sp. NPDC004667]|uniref:methyltransferase family protein n=1 Tax=Streptomyces sp. NPDC004667 TaxID=3154285 RepID=UPI00339FC943